MNPRGFGPGHWVATRLPDGRYVMAPHDDPVAPVIRRLNAARTPHGTAWGDPEDWAAVTAWMDAKEPLEAPPLRLVQGELLTRAEVSSPAAAAPGQARKEAAA